MNTSNNINNMSDEDLLDQFMNEENDNNNNKINIDYDSDIYVELLNTFILNYKKMYPEKVITSMFDNININDYSSTNHMIEMFYEEMLKYSNKIKNNDLFGLSVDDNIISTSNNIIELLLQVIDKHKNSNWVIINLK